MVKEEFEKAANEVNNLARRPSNEELLQLYALYKQAIEGDVKGEKPGGFDFKAIAKYNSWKELSGTPNEEAMKKYINLVEDLKQKLG